MLPGFSGSLVSEYFAEEYLPSLFAGRIGEAARDGARSRLLRWRRAVLPRLGPVSGPRAVYDLAAAPIVAVLGFQPGRVTGSARTDFVLAAPDAGAPGSPLLLVTAWSDRLDATWRDAVRHSVSADVSWCLCTNGRELRLVDARRTYARRFAQFDLDSAIADERSFGVLWALLRREAFDGDPAPIDEIVEASAEHTVGVCRSLRRGVLDALADLLSGFTAGQGRARRADGDLDGVHEQALTIVYRILFLLFAESRGLVPSWNPIYRQGYSLEAARNLAERPGPARGLWETLQAISRLAHRGCRAGTLRVTPFNGRLFAPSATPLGENGRLDDETTRRVVLALSTSPGRAGEGRARIAYRDLGVEQLGAVYESVLDYRPRLSLRPDRSRAGATARPHGAGVVRGGVRSTRVELVAGGGRRKASGTFYTPRSITSFIVRRTIAPLVAEAPPEGILELRVVDPAMGSGAFLVAACRYLAGAYEAAILRQGGCHPSDISEEDRRGFRRAVAQRCLFGVDRDPIAVQLARLSLWLSTLAPDRPLTFLDHHLLAGDSLVGASLDDLLRPPPGAGSARPRRADRPTLPLFESDEAGPAMRAVLPARLRLASTPDESLEVVREKERLLAGLAGDASPLARLRATADLWCGCAFRPAGARVGAALFAELAGRLLRGTSALPASTSAPWLAEARALASERRFFHWSLEFPEVFFAPDGTPQQRPGFDAVVGNPPWDMIRADNEEDEDSPAVRAAARQLLQFARTSGLYRAQGDGHGNLFQLFVERAFRLTRDGGRIGLVVPWGLAADSGCAALRRLLLDRCHVDSWIGFENSAAIFPIHRSVRFLVLTATTGQPTPALPCRLGARDPSVLDTMPDLPGPCAEVRSVVLTRGLLERISPGDLAIPDVRTAKDVELLERLSSESPPLGSAEGWHAAFGRELNASDDRRHFDERAGGLPVLEGKHVEPFRVTCSGATRRLPRAVAARLLDPARTFCRPRLAYRDVASATNRLTLIAAVLPAGCVTVHTLFCLKTALGRPEQDFLCGILNSFVANYLVRLRVTTHVTAGIVARLPVPRPPAESPLYGRVAGLAAALGRSPAPQADPAYPDLQAAVAHLYNLADDELAHVLGTFPLVDAGVKRATLDSFRDGVTAPRRSGFQGG
jgi:hypothetical protein